MTMSNRTLREIALTESRCRVLPPLARSSNERMRMKVVLPAPFGPTSPNMPVPMFRSIRTGGAIAGA